MFMCHSSSICPILVYFGNNLREQGTNIPLDSRMNLTVFDSQRQTFTGIEHGIDLLDVMFRTTMETTQLDLKMNWFDFHLFYIAHLCFCE